MTTLWKWICAVGAGLVAVLTLGAWKRREAEGSGERKAKQDAEREKAKQFTEEFVALRQRQAARLQAEINREQAEAQARRLADAATMTPPAAPQSAEDVLEAVRRQRRDVR